VLPCKVTDVKNAFFIANSVCAEAEGFRDFAAEGIFQKFFTAFGAEIEAELLIYVFADLIVIGVFQGFEDILNFLEVVAVVFVLTRGCRIKGCVDFHFHDIAEIFMRIQIPLAQIA